MWHEPNREPTQKDVGFKRPRRIAMRGLRHCERCIHALLLYPDPLKEFGTAGWIPEQSADSFLVAPAPRVQRSTGHLRSHQHRAVLARLTRLVLRATRAVDSCRIAFQTDWQ